MDITTQIERAARLKAARVAAGFKSAKEAAQRHNFNYTTYSQHERGHAGIGKASSDYARAFRVSEGWLLTGEDGQSSPTDRIPLLGTAAGASFGAWRMEAEPIDFLPSPPGLIGVESAYAILVKGNSMSPEHRDGALRFINPVKRPVSGDSVIIQQQIAPNAPIEMFIKKFVRDTGAEYITEQLEPHAFIRFPKNTVTAIHKVTTMNELFHL